jgi:hypothetical protein
MESWWRQKCWHHLIERCNKLNFDIPIVTPRGVVYGIRMRRSKVQKEVMMTRTETKEDENLVELNVEEDQIEDTIYDEPNAIQNMDTHEDEPKNEDKSKMETQNGNQEEKLHCDEESKNNNSNMDTQDGNQEAKSKRTDLEDAIKTDIKIPHNDKGSERTPTPETQFKPNYRDIVAMNLDTNLMIQNHPEKMNLDTDPINQNHMATKKTKSRLGSKNIKGTGQNVVEKENFDKANEYRTEANENGWYEVKTRRSRHTDQTAFKTTKFEVGENVGIHFKYKNLPKHAHRSCRSISNSNYR